MSTPAALPGYAVFSHDLSHVLFVLCATALCSCGDKSRKACIQWCFSALNLPRKGPIKRNQADRAMIGTVRLNSVLSQLLLQEVLSDGDVYVVVRALRSSCRMGSVL